MTILLDNGHGENTRGKCSPDQRIKEWRTARDIAAETERALGRLGFDARLITPESTDVSLAERVRRVNGCVRRYGRDNVLLVSIHLNAKGNGYKWETARGWQVCVGLNASQRSKALAKTLTDAAARQGLTVRKPSPSQPWWAQDLAVCRDTLCPAVLTENLFMDNREDAALLASAEGRQRLIDLHVQGIKDYINAL